MSQITEKEKAVGQTDETLVRLVALFVFLLTIGYIVTQRVALPVLLAADFTLRVLNAGKFSPLLQISKSISHALNLSKKPIFAAPKRFAAGIGLLFSLVILALHLSGINTNIPSGILAFFAALESFIGFCAGCYIYQLLPDWSKK
jgi:hypothetical protein